jgi:uncharacterized protein (DUF934 family)
MPKIIKLGTVIDDDWKPVSTDSAAISGSNQILTLEQWQQLDDKTGSAVQLEPGEDANALAACLAQIKLIVINFPVFTDGRGFSYARQLRDQGYTGELRAAGHFIRDQLTYLSRCGFDAFQMADENDLEAALDSMGDFSEFYQAAVDQPLPLFRRRQNLAG